MDILHVNHDDLDGPEHDGGIDMLKLRQHTFADMLALFDILCLVARKCREDGDAAPFRALVERDEQFGEGGRVNDEG